MKQANKRYLSEKRAIPIKLTNKQALTNKPYLSDKQAIPIKLTKNTKQTSYNKRAIPIEQTTIPVKLTKNKQTSYNKQAIPIGQTSHTYRTNEPYLSDKRTIPIKLTKNKQRSYNKRAVPIGQTTIPVKQTSHKKRAILVLVGETGHTCQRVLSRAFEL